MKPPYLALIEHVVKECAEGKRKLDLATEIERALFGCGFRIISAKELEELKGFASRAKRIDVRRYGMHREFAKAMRQ
jgi:hypothetical protein